MHYGFVPPGNPHDEVLLFPALDAALEWYFDRAVPQVRLLLMTLGLARRLTARQVLQQTSQSFPDPKERAAIFAQQLEGSTLHMFSFYRQTELRGRSAAVVQCPVLPTWTTSGS